jgi:hypothetical protein
MASPLEAILAYYEAFSTLDLGAIVAHFCEPSLMVSGQGVFAAGNRAGLANAMTPLVESLRARQYGRSEFVEPHVTKLGDADALVRGVAVRYTAAGPELERVPLSYLLHRTDAGWKIVVLVADQAAAASSS